VAQGAPAAFFSYCREDSEFALRLAGDLKAAGANVWLDQLDIIPGDRWDHAVENALTHCSRLLVILSPSSVSSTNVMDEVSFALEERKIVIPVIHRDCTVPFRLRRVQHLDFRQDYARGLQELLKTLAPGQSAGQSMSAISDVESPIRSNVPDAEERQRAAEQARLEAERRKVSEETRREDEYQQAAEQARVEQERLAEAADRARRTRQEETERRAREQVTGERLQSEKVEADRDSRKNVLTPGLTSQRREDQKLRLNLRSWKSLIALPLIGAAGWLTFHYTTANSVSRNPELHYGNGEALRSQKNVDGAITEYRKAIQLKPDYAAAHTGLAIALQDKGNLNEAIAEFREVSRLIPNAPEAHDLLGSSLSQKGDLNGAITEYREAVRLDPQNAGTHYNLARTLDKNGEHDAAIAEYREALRLKPEFAKSHPMPELPPIEKKESAPTAPVPRQVSVPKKNAVDKTIPKRIRVGGNVQAAHLANRVQPIYPPLARQTHVSGTVKLHAIIGKDGAVEQLQVISGHPLLVQAALDAVKQWRYQSTLLGGEPVEVDTEIDVIFSLAQ
jgi:TonB family protein